MSDLKILRTGALTPDTTKRVFLNTSSSVYSAGTASVVNGNDAIAGNAVSWERDNRVIPGLVAFVKNGASSVQEYFAISKTDDGSEEITLDRDYEQATDPVAAYTIREITPARKYEVQNTHATQEAVIYEILRDGTISSVGKTIKAGDVFNSGEGQYLGLQYEASAAGSLLVTFWGSF